MKKLFQAADRYIQTSDWKIITVLKFCLISLGLLVGLLIKPQQKKRVFLVALVVFLASYIPLMVRLFRVFSETKGE